MIKAIQSLSFVACLLFTSLSAYAHTSVTDLRVQHLAEPLAVEDARPLFSWRMESDVAGQEQKAYRLAVVRESDRRTVWDSGRMESGLSDNIRYLGVALQPEMGYSWTVTVWDAQGGMHVASSRFETGLMNPALAAWEGATFIGSKAPRLDAASHYYFEINTRFRIVEGDKMSLVLGANDFRLQDAFQNPGNLAGENYVRVEIDLSGVGTKKGAALNIYRKGYAADDREDKPLISISAKDYPECNINQLLTLENKHEEHTLSIGVETSNIHFLIDGKDLRTTPGQYHAFSSGFAVGNSSLNNNNATRFPIGVWGTTHDFNTSPNLCSVGFAALPGCKVVYTDYQIKNCGYSRDNVVFDNRHYAVFSALPHVKVEGNRLVVENPSADMAVEYADPTHGALTMLRSEFGTKGKIQKAKVYATAMGAFELFINGERVGNEWFAPGDDQYRELLGYRVYDVTGLLREGDNCVAALLNPGWYTGYMTFMTVNFNFFGDHEALLLKLVIDYEDGSREVIVSNPETWKAFNDGPVRYGSFFNGERYDARREAAVAGWKESGYADGLWKPAETIEPREWAAFAIRARYDNPVQVREVLTATRVTPTHSEDGHTYIYDMGVNMVGVPSVTIPAGWLEAGDTVIMRYGEQLYPGLKGDDREYVRKFGKRKNYIAGRPLYETYRAALATDFYIAKGSEAVTICPTTSYRGYQYIQITLPGHGKPLPLENIKGLVLSSDELPAGTYRAETADDNYTGRLANQLFKNIQRSQLGNFFTIPTDCPQRNERMGWTGDAQAYVRTATYNSDVLNFFRQWMAMLRADQGIGSRTDVPGGVGSTVPTYNQTDDTSFPDGTTWAAAICMVPWQLYSQYGDTQVVRENMEAMMNWLNGMDFYDFSEGYPHLSAKTTGLGDWLAMDERTPADLVNNAIYIYMMEVTARMADAIGEKDYADVLRRRHALAKEEWNKLYVSSETGKTRTAEGVLVHSQSSYATPLRFNCFDEVNRPKAEAWLAALAANPSASGEGKKKYPPYTITTGFSGTPNILPALSRSGHQEEAYRMFTCTDFTSWLYPVTKGATSVWERWNGYEVAFGKTNENHMNSFNHFALGSVGQWMYEFQLGITSDEGGYKHFILQPGAGGNYTKLEGSYESHYGTIRSAWTADGQGRMLTYRATVPANTTATLYLPLHGEGQRYGKSTHARFSGREEHCGHSCARYELASGTYTFMLADEGITVTEE